MHDAAYDWLTDLAEDIAGQEMRARDESDTRRRTGLDVGAGGELGDKVRALFGWVRWSTVDWNPDTAPDHVADMTQLVLPEALPAEGFDLVLCTEVLEHVPDWRTLVKNCVRLVAPGGHLVLTCAATGREPHSALDGGPLRADEYYRNVEPWELAAQLIAVGPRYGLVLRRFVRARPAHDLYVHGEVQRHG